MNQHVSARDWAINTLQEIAASINRKTNLKRAQAVLGPGALVDEFLLIARHKRDAYKRARGGPSVVLGAWITTNPELARATLALTSYDLPINDVPMMFEEAQC